MPGARCTRSLVCAIGSKYAHEYSQRATGNHPTFPHAMVYGLYRALPGDRLSCHRHLRKPGSSAPGWADLPSANLTPASRRQDHTTSPSASASFVCTLLIAHDPRRDRPATTLRADTAASTASRPAFVTIASRPSVWDETSGVIKLIWVFGKPEYFLREGWTKRSGGALLICPSGSLQMMVHGRPE
jgi:hypothetical protein